MVSQSRDIHMPRWWGATGAWGYFRLAPGWCAVFLRRSLVDKRTEVMCQRIRLRANKVAEGRNPYSEGFQSVWSFERRRREYARYDLGAFGTEGRIESEVGEREPACCGCWCKYLLEEHALSLFCCKAAIVRHCNERRLRSGSALRWGNVSLAPAPAHQLALQVQAPDSLKARTARHLTSEPSHLT